MTTCQCDRPGVDHSARCCPKVGTIRAERNGVELMLCCDCILSSDTTKLDRDPDDPQCGHWDEAGRCPQTATQVATCADETGERAVFRLCDEHVAAYRAMPEDIDVLDVVPIEDYDDTDYELEAEIERQEAEKEADRLNRQRW